ncbi:MAG: hypothetical protein Q4B52_03765 [Tissierellia bacterium]|nr:hypothetical protein [Tissierellia bacterium]
MKDQKKRDAFDLLEMPYPYSLNRRYGTDYENYKIMLITELSEAMDDPEYFNFTFEALINTLARTLEYFEEFVLQDIFDEDLIIERIDILVESGYLEFVDPEHGKDKDYYFKNYKDIKLLRNLEKAQNRVFEDYMLLSFNPILINKFSNTLNILHFQPDDHVHKFPMLGLQATMYDYFKNADDYIIHLLHYRLSRDLYDF